MSEATLHIGSCHCGDVKYQVKLDLDQTLTTCNCSICSRTGAIMAFVPEADFTLESGEDALTDYQFGKKHVHHLFCPTCGIRSFARGAGKDGKMTYMINVRCLQGADATSLKTQQFDGKSL